jgi:hypothetical protein
LIGRLIGGTWNKSGSDKEECLQALAQYSAAISLHLQGFRSLPEV